MFGHSQSRRHKGHPAQEKNSVLDRRGKVVLVTGLTGNQGGVTARHLLAAGAELVRGGSG